MKLSEAMMLGSVTCKMVPGDWNSCALGCAGNAVGIERGQQIARARLIRAYWPWLNKIDSRKMESLGASIFLMFDHDVCVGNMTFEQLVDYVRSIEPSCGECNRFECSCVKSEALPVAESVLA